MSSTDFLPVRKLAGELIISQTREQSRCSLTSKELVFQKPHVSYYLMLQDIVGIVPYPIKDLPGSMQGRTPEHYQITCQEILVINRSGVHIQSSANLILPIHHRILHRLTRMQNLTKVS